MADNTNPGNRRPIPVPEIPSVPPPTTPERSESDLDEKRATNGGGHEAHDSPEAAVALDHPERETSKGYGDAKPQSARSRSVRSRSTRHSRQASDNDVGSGSDDDDDERSNHNSRSRGGGAAAGDDSSAAGIGHDNELVLALTHVSSLAGAEQPAAQPWSSYVEIPDAFYDRMTAGRKRGVVALLSFCAFLAPVSSTAMLPAVPNLAAEFHTTGTIINISAALYLVFMGLSPVVWGPLSEVYGRRWISLGTCVLFLLCNVATALAPNLAAFFVFRILTAFEGTSFILVGSAAISDMYRPTERATAMGWFLLGTLIGPALGPFVGGIIVTYRSWRVIFWLQTALIGLGFVGLVFLLPETIHHRKIDDLAGYSPRRKARVLWTLINPARVFRTFLYPNVLVAGLGSSAIMWNMYTLLTPIRYVLNPRFGLTTPMQSGLFYLAPGAGYVLGAALGGRYADYTVRRWIVRRGGVRVPEDRLRSALPFMGIVQPACILVYAWGVDRGVGGIPLAVVMLFLQGVAQLFCFPSLNTYCLDVMQSRGSDVIAGNYFIRFLFAGGCTAAVLPATEAIGVGWLNTIGALFLAGTAACMYACVLWGSQWRTHMDQRQGRKRKAAAERAARTQTGTV